MFSWEHLNIKLTKREFRNKKTSVELEATVVFSSLMLYHFQYEMSTQLYTNCMNNFYFFKTYLSITSTTATINYFKLACHPMQQLVLYLLRDYNILFLNTTFKYTTKAQKQRDFFKKNNKVMKIISNRFYARSFLSVVDMNSFFSSHYCNYFLRRSDFLSSINKETILAN